MNPEKLIGKKFEIFQGDELDGLATVKKIAIDYPTLLERDDTFDYYRVYCTVRFDGEHRFFNRWVTVKYNRVTHEITQ